MVVLFLQKEYIQVQLSKEQILEKVYGYTTLRPLQQEAINSVLEHIDTLCELPASYGKSICYQIPALLFEGVTIVISPLIALMQEQVGFLKEHGVQATFISQQMTMQEKYYINEDIKRGKYKIIYVSPERFVQPAFIGLLQKLDISFIAIDEAHCAVRWGHRFRKSYLEIANAINHLNKRPTIGAYTATATVSDEKEIIRILGLKQAKIIRKESPKNNIQYEIIRANNKFDKLRSLLIENKDKTVVVFCATQKIVEDISLLLSREFCVSKYHAGMSAEERAKNRQDYMLHKTNIMRATNAFGLGINNDKIDLVIHYNMPLSIHNYYQETARAGRTNRRARSILLYSTSDRRLLRTIIRGDDVADNEIDKIDDMVSKGTNIRNELNRYFKHK